MAFPMDNYRKTLKSKHSHRTTAMVRGYLSATENGLLKTDKICVFCFLPNLNLHKSAIKCIQMDMTVLLFGGEIIKYIEYIVCFYYIQPLCIFYNSIVSVII